MATGQPLAFAGLWDAWKEPDGGWLISYAIITTEPNELTAKVHNRMPVILKPGDYDRWLSRDETERPPADLLRPYDPDKMTTHPVDPRVGNVKVNEPGLCDAWSCSPNSA
jgi:putative SOS response-associated peptidase YedK